MSTRVSDGFLAGGLRCETCKWWRAISSDVCSDCSNPAVDGIFGDEGQTVPPDFGCVMWDAKPAT